jgi:hypothetical protein
VSRITKTWIQLALTCRKDSDSHDYDSTLNPLRETPSRGETFGSENEFIARKSVLLKRINTGSGSHNMIDTRDMATQPMGLSYGPDEQQHDQRGP